MIHLESTTQWRPAADELPIDEQGQCQIEFNTKEEDDPSVEIVAVPTGQCQLNEELEEGNEDVEKERGMTPGGQWRVEVAKVLVAPRGEEEKSDRISGKDGHVGEEIGIELDDVAGFLPQLLVVEKDAGEGEIDFGPDPADDKHEEDTVDVVHFDGWIEGAIRASYDVIAPFVVVDIFGRIALFIFAVGNGHY